MYHTAAPLSNDFASEYANSDRGRANKRSLFPISPPVQLFAFHAHTVTLSRELSLTSSNYTFLSYYEGEAVVLEEVMVSAGEVVEQDVESRPITDILDQEVS